MWMLGTKPGSSHFFAFFSPVSLTGVLKLHGMTFSLTLELKLKPTTVFKLNGSYLI